MNSDGSIVEETIYGNTSVEAESFASFAKKRYGHHIAITHVANKMMTIIWHMLSYKRLYNDRKQNLYDAKLKKIHKT